jgi:hypothetical protein
LRFVVVIAFLKPLSVTPPFATRFTEMGGRQQAARGSALENRAKAKTVTEAEGQEGAADAVLGSLRWSRLGVGPASSERWGDGGREKRRRQTT